MIRYVLAALLAAALLGIAFPIAEQQAAANSERSVEGSIAKIDSAAMELLQEERLPPKGMPSPQRSVTLSFPRDSLTNAPVRHFKIEQVSGEDMSRVEYAIEGRPMKTTHIDAPIVAESTQDPVNLGRPSGEMTLVLSLQRDQNDDDRPVVAINRTSR